LPHHRFLIYSLAVKIAVMADSHDNCDALARALSLASRRGVQHVIHLGDVISAFTSRVFKAHFGGEITILFGNNDGDRVALMEKFSPLGARFFHPPTTIQVGGIVIAAMHEPLFPEFLSASKRFQAIMWGHTHQLEIKEMDGVLALNPGELHGFVTGKKTFILLDTETMEPEVAQV